MKKILVCLLMCIISFALVSCGGNESDSSEKSESKKTVTEKTQAESQNGFQADDLGESYTEMSGDTEEYLNIIMMYSKKIFPQAEGEWRYGYKGSEPINNENCFVFTVFTENDDSNSKVGVVAVSEKGKNIYVLNEDNHKYEIFTPQDDSSK